MPDLAERLRAMLGPMTVEYKTDCANNAAIGGFDRHMHRLLREAHAAVGHDDEARAHLDRLALLFADYAELDQETRARRLREAKRRLDALLAAPPPASLSPALPKPRRHPERGLAEAVQWVKGVGPNRAAVLGRLGIETIGDLLFHFPRRHEDRSMLLPLREAQLGVLATYQARVTYLEDYSPRPGLKLTKATVSDGSGLLQLIWFNSPWIVRELKVDDQIIFSGKLTLDNRGKRQLSQPIWELDDPESESLNTGRLVPIYPLTEGLQHGYVRRIIHQALDEWLPLLPEVIPAALLKHYDLLDRRAAVAGYHFPQSEQQRLTARRRLVFEEFFGLQVALAQRRHLYQHRGHGIAFDTDSSLVRRLLDGLPFELTQAQQRVLRDIGADMARSLPMNRLLQGDVGSGKTLIALAAMLVAVDNGYQAAVMAPTEVLAEQLHRVISHYGAPLGVSVDLFTGRAGAAQRRESAERLAGGVTQIAVGTHALLQETVEFARLGLVVVDEQHRFGVLQRKDLSRKGVTPDVLVMTATPIPRTLALTLYGDLDTSVIDELPAGRKPIVTEWFPLGQRAKLYSRIKQRLKEGRQAYVVAPLVEESEKVDLEAATALAEQLTVAFKGWQVGLIHGKLKPQEKDEVMTAFRAGQLKLLVATTVIEVGIDVPNATVMLIVNAERFGLSQLHQIRGRVGRGSHESECYLLTDARWDPSRADEEADLQYRDGRQRLRFLLEYLDGFKLAEADLALRGPGELGGTRQSGVMDLHVANLARDQGLLQEAREAAQTLVARDPRLAEDEHRALREYVREKFRDKGELAEVG